MPFELVSFCIIKSYSLIPTLYEVNKFPLSKLESNFNPLYFLLSYSCIIGLYSFYFIVDGKRFLYKIDGNSVNLISLFKAISFLQSKKHEAANRWLFNGIIDHG